MPRSDQRGRNWIVLAKALVTILILGYLLTRIDIGRSATLLARSHRGWLLLAFVVNSLALITSSLKWDGLLRAVGVRASRWAVLELYTIGFFASSFLPGVIGGDVLRWQLAGGDRHMRVKVAATILIERITGVVALVLMCILVVLIMADQLATPPVLGLLLAMSLGLILGLAIVLHRGLATRLVYRTRRWRIKRVLRRLYELHRAVRLFPRRPLIAALVWSVVFYLSVGFTFYLMANTVGAEVGVLQAVAVQILICLLTLVPISLGGLGLAQAGDVYLLGQFGVSPERALALSILRQLIAYAYVAIGGLMFVRWQQRIPHDTGTSGKATVLAHGVTAAPDQKVER